ncbi:MAG TPA: hypothetical protein VGI39_08160 [Polyangiaceae bacterium]|jgi:hypothetical protein
MKNDNKSEKKVNVEAAVNALKVQSNVRAGLFTPISSPGGCRGCGINSILG